MKFDIEVPSLEGVARVEILCTREGEAWAAYVAFVANLRKEDTCLLLGQGGIPYRFEAPSRNEAEEAAKAFLKEKYRVCRMVWS